MWVLGVTLLLMVTSSVSLVLTRREEEPQADIWDVPNTARTFTTIVGSLAGFSVTSAIFIANLTVARQSAAFESVIALFLIAFLTFISCAMQYGTTPNLLIPTTDLYQTIQRYSYLFANATYYLAICLSWLGLPLLLVAVGLNYLGDVFIWFDPLTAVVGGAIRFASGALNVLARVELRASLSLLAICLIAAVFYRLVLAELLDNLLPAEHGPALFAVVCALVATAGISAQSLIVSSLGRSSTAAVAKVGRTLLLIYAALVYTTSALLWLAVYAAL